MEILFVHIVRVLKIMFVMKKVITRMIVDKEMDFISDYTDITVNTWNYDKKTA